MDLYKRTIKIDGIIEEIKHSVIYSSGQETMKEVVDGWLTISGINENTKCVDVHIELVEEDVNYIFSLNEKDSQYIPLD